MMSKRIILLFAAFVLASGVAFASLPGTSPGPGVHYATDAFPGFDREAPLSDRKKEPRWFACINGPSKDNAATQFAYASECMASNSWRAARKGFDALVREWPTSPEAPKAQKALADLYLEHYLEYENAFREYKYLLDFYSTQCDFDAIAFRLYEVAKLMREEGKSIMFVRFDNTVTVRRAFESVVLRAPGARFAAEAMLTIGELRENDQEYVQAVQVYENLRNLYANTVEAKTALVREARCRMKILHEHGYNRSRNQDTIDFLKLALQSGSSSDVRSELEGYLSEAVRNIENEAYAAAKFYDSRTRTKRSAIKAYERFLKTYPASEHADEVRRRLAELQEEGK